MEGEHVELVRLCEDYMRQVGELLQHKSYSPGTRAIGDSICRYAQALHDELRLAGVYLAEGGVYDVSKHMCFDRDEQQLQALSTETMEAWRCPFNNNVYCSLDRMCGSCAERHS
jgi:hypothetical protein